MTKSISSLKSNFKILTREQQILINGGIEKCKISTPKGKKGGNCPKR